MVRKTKRTMSEPRAKEWAQEFQRLLAAPPVFPRETPTVIDGFEVPAWWECAWRRVPCKKATCRFCGRFQKLRRLLESDGTEKEFEEQEKQEADLADLKEVTAFQAKDLGIREEDVLGEEIDEDDFDEDGNYIGEEDKPGRLIPEPETFLLYNRVKRWSRPLTRFVGEAHERGEGWAKTEAAEDLLWYGTLIIGKVYRQLSTKYELAHEIEEWEYLKPEFVYTGYVLREISEIIARALAELTKLHADLETPLRQFHRLKPSITDSTKV